MGRGLDVSRRSRPPAPAAASARRPRPQRTSTAYGRRLRGPGTGSKMRSYGAPPFLVGSCWFMCLESLCTGELGLRRGRGLSESMTRDCQRE